MSKCYCGCGGDTNPGRIYVNGHNTRKEIIGRFCDKLKTFHWSNCVIFMGTINSHGYGQFRTRWDPEYTIGAHIFAYILYYHREPTMDIHHKCHNRRCCNPLHLEERARGTH